jgi:hypothetical protein
MKRNPTQGSLILLLLLLFAGACKKSIDQVNPAENPAVPNDSTTAVTTATPFPVSPLAECDNAPFYGDSIVYPQPSEASDYYVYPQNNQGVAGTYFSWPVGLQMNSSTGAINITQSETGARYAVAFVKENTTDTCMSELIVGGAAYADSVYVLSLSNKTAKPYFNADPAGPQPCVGTQGSGCVFDYNNAAHNQGIEIDQKTGFIDLQKTMEKSPFGLLPINGTTVYTTINYKLNDASNFAPQKITLKMVYYNHKSDIPPGLLQTVTDNLIQTLNDLLISKGPSPRPPLIVIVRYP